MELADEMCEISVDWCNLGVDDASGETTIDRVLKAPVEKRNGASGDGDMSALEVRS